MAAEWRPRLTWPEALVGVRLLAQAIWASVKEDSVNNSDVFEDMDRSRLARGQDHVDLRR